MLPRRHTAGEIGIGTDTRNAATGTGGIVRGESSVRSPGPTALDHAAADPSGFGSSICRTLGVNIPAYPDFPQRFRHKGGNVRESDLSAEEGFHRFLIRGDETGRAGPPGADRLPRRL